ncbi:basic proline-rich protein precursor [Rhodococcus aetherivorans]|uniref:Basic proline-rich protein n=1 Tax=Rhodococcus aetherivorans TaxID=191292 RepID=A0ABQ0YW32_9NOCA|nr:basic proline-rich protein precursor [Rhodococcus aetherivorans]
MRRAVDLCWPLHLSCTTHNTAGQGIVPGNPSNSARTDDNPPRKTSRARPVPVTLDLPHDAAVVPGCRLRPSGAPGAAATSPPPGGARRHHGCHRDEGRSPVSAAVCAQGLDVLQAGHDDRPEDARADVHRDLVRLLPDRRADGPADPQRTRRPGHAVPVQRAVQPAVHHARRHHAADVRDPDRVRVRELHPAAADRRARRRVPPAERVQLLAVPVRRLRRGLLPRHPGRRPGLRVDLLRSARGRPAQPRCRRKPVVRRSGRRRSRHHPRRGQHDHHGRVPACPRYDDVPDADLHLEHLHHDDSDPADLPAADRRVHGSAGRSRARRQHLRPGQRRGDALPAPVLVLRPPRGVCHRAAVLRHHLRGHSGVLA